MDVPINNENQKTAMLEGQNHQAIIKEVKLTVGLMQPDFIFSYYTKKGTVLFNTI